jgi:divalent metal cation (Fe/Co/Zn/Cd) transporter
MKGQQETLKQKALLLVWIGELWNVLEVVVALSAGIGAGSVALIAFGLDSVVELFAGGVLIWRLQSMWSKTEEESAESKAHKLVGVSFFVLAGYILFHSIVSLLGLLPKPETSIVGVVLILASALVMSVLYFRKISIAKKLNSPALQAEAKQSLFCDLQDLPVIIGLGANALFGWWWADPLVALALIPFIIKEGREAF